MKLVPEFIKRKIVGSFLKDEGNRYFINLEMGDAIRDFVFHKYLSDNGNKRLYDLLPDNTKCEISERYMRDLGPSAVYNMIPDSFVRYIIQTHVGKVCDGVTGDLHICKQVNFGKNGNLKKYEPIVRINDMGVVRSKSSVSGKG